MRVYIETYGCALNRADSLIMERALRREGHSVVDSPDLADVIVINTCTVRLDTEYRMRKVLRRYADYARSSGKKLVVAGCMAQAEPYLVRKVAPQASLISPQNASRIAELLKSEEWPVVMLGGERPTAELPELVQGVTGVLPLGEGCLGDCSFCIVKIARRRLVSYPPRVILECVKRLVKRGVVEIYLTSMDAAAYGRDIPGRVRLSDLLSSVVEILEREGSKAMIRIGMMNPDTLLPILDEVIEVARSRNVYKFFHIPLQSGDDRVLKLMNRRYSVEEFAEIVRSIRRRLPDPLIATDIIVGHPGEDEEAFRNTVEAVRRFRFERVHLAQYTLRPHTRAASMPQVPDSVKKRRSDELMRVIEEQCLKANREYVGSTAVAMVTEVGRGGTLVARLRNYQPVVVGAREGVRLGSEVKLRVTGATFYDLRGEVVSVLS